MTRSLSEHLARDGKKRILAIDGGGARGILSIAILKRIETILAERLPVEERANFRLHHYYDLIGGTSTGAILAAGLAIGLSVDDLRTFYFDLCPQIFRPRRGAGAGTARFDSKALETALHRVLRENAGRPETLPLGGKQAKGQPITLGSPALRTGLAVFSKRIDTGGAWTLTNNPDWTFYDQDAAARYHERFGGEAPPDFSDNKALPLSRIVMASAAAPTYFERVALGVEAESSGRLGVQVNDINKLKGMEKAEFVDGGLGGRNTPALQMLIMATHPAYGYGWETGEDQLLVTSVGSGWWRPRVTDKIIRSEMRIPQLRPAAHAIKCLQSMIHDTSLNALTILQSLSREPEHPAKRWRIDAELQRMTDYLLPSEPLLRFRRMDVRLDETEIDELLGQSLEKEVTAQGLSVRLSKQDVKQGQAWRESPIVMRLRNLGEADLDVLKLSYTLGARYAQTFVDASDFPTAFDPPGMGGDGSDTVTVDPDLDSARGKRIAEIAVELREEEETASASAPLAPSPAEDTPTVVAAAAETPAPPPAPAPAPPVTPPQDADWTPAAREEAVRRAGAIARVAHEALRAWQIELGQAPAPPWDEAEDWQRKSTKEAVLFRLNNPDAPASAQHDDWMRERLADGWRFGPVKDPEAKTHPMLRPYDELPTDERKKDALIAAVIRGLAMDV